jgi:chromosome segregation ATPase
MRCLRFTIANVALVSLVAEAALINEASSLARQPSKANSRLLLRGAVIAKRRSNESDGGESHVGDDEDPSAEVREDFVRKCKITVDVGDPKMLPVGSLEKFCSMTQAVVECRSKLVERLKADHASGSNLEGFCGAVYDWFQGKYGMFCPAQCNKLQCRPTCAWLKRQKTLNDAAKEIKAGVKASGESRAATEQLARAVKEAKAEETRQNRSVEQAGVTLARAERDKQEAEADFNNEKAKHDRMQNESLAREEAVRQGAAAIDTGSMQLRELEREIDKAEVNQTRMVRELASVEEDIASKAKEYKAQTDELSAGEDDMQVLRAAADEARKEVGKASDAVIAQQDVALKRSDALQRARDKLDAAISEGNHSSETIKGFEGLIKDQKIRYSKAKDKLNDLNSTKRRAEQETRHADEKIEVMNQRLEGLRNRTTVAKLKITDVNTTFGRLKSEADAFAENEVKARQEAAEALRRNNTQRVKDQKTAETTWKFAIKAAEEQQERLSAAEAKLAERHLSVAGAEAALAAAQELLTTKTQELEKLVSKENEQIADFEAEYGELERRLAVHKNATETLRKDTPEIVLQHGLGLLIEVVSGALAA